MKGTRSSPQCGFSYKMLSILNDSRTDYEVVNVLDDFHNPGQARAAVVLRVLAHTACSSGVAGAGASGTLCSEF